MLWIALVLFIVGEAVAQVPSLGSCPNLKTVKNFNLGKCMGRWYVAEMSFDLFHLGDRCVTTNYTLNKNGSFLVTNSRISIIGKPSSIDGIGYPIDDSGDAKFKITYPSLGVVETYLILGTDYDNWIVISNCHDKKFFSVSYIWILVKERNPAASVLLEAYKVLDENKISKTWFVKVDQKNCPESY